MITQIAATTNKLILMFYLIRENDFDECVFKATNLASNLNSVFTEQRVHWKLFNQRVRFDHYKAFKVLTLNMFSCLKEELKNNASFRCRVPIRLQLGASKLS